VSAVVAVVALPDNAPEKVGAVTVPLTSRAVAGLVVPMPGLLVF